MVDPFKGLKLPERFSATFVGSATQCMLKARFDREVSVGGPFATIGSAAHEVFATCEFKAQLSRLSQIYPAEALEIAERVLMNPERAANMTYDMHSTVVAMVERWAERVTFPLDADKWVIEHPFRLPLHDRELGITYTISGRIDRYAIWDKERHYECKDWKTGPGLPSRAEVEQEHTQMPIYAWAAFQEYPYIETFDSTEFYCRKGVPRSVTFTAAEIPDIEAWLIGRCRAIRKAWLEASWEPNPSERWCNYCPMPDRCPLPESVRLAAVVRTEEDAVRHMQSAIVMEARRKQAIGAFKGYLELSGQDFIEVGGKLHGYVPKKSRRMNKKRLDEALALVGKTAEDFMETERGQEFGSRKA